MHSTISKNSTYDKIIEPMDVTWNKWFRGFTVQEDQTLKG